MKRTRDLPRLARARLSRLDPWPVWLLLQMTLCWLLLHAISGDSFCGPSYYNTYTLQALAWREGRCFLSRDYPALELAIYQGNYYVSFPPLPSLVLLPLTFLFGAGTPDNLLVKLYAAGACLLIYASLKRAGYARPRSAAFAFLFCFGSSLLPMTVQGAVWYHAQTLAFFLMTASIAFMLRDQPTSALLCYALSVACRPFDALYALPLFLVYFLRRRRAGVGFGHALRGALPGIGLGLCVAAGLAAYNWVRFGDPLEFGHNYLPEFSFQGGTQFSLSHVLPNLRTFLLGMPLEQTASGLRFKKFGYSMLLACPALTLTLLHFIRDCIRREVTPEKAAIAFTMLAHLFLLLLHRTFGGYQLGARYAVDAMPYALLYALLSRERKGWSLFSLHILAYALVFTVWGFSQVHI